VGNVSQETAERGSIGQRLVIREESVGRAVDLVSLLMKKLEELVQ
jgi:hypothetical protein